jgi:hypothetical protein
MIDVGNVHINFGGYFMRFFITVGVNVGEGRSWCGLCGRLEAVSLSSVFYMPLFKSKGCTKPPLLHYSCVSVNHHRQCVQCTTLPTQLIWYKKSAGPSDGFTAFPGDYNGVLWHQVNAFLLDLTGPVYIT